MENPVRLSSHSPFVGEVLLMTLSEDHFSSESIKRRHLITSLYTYDTHSSPLVHLTTTSPNNKNRSASEINQSINQSIMDPL